MKHKYFIFFAIFYLSHNFIECGKKSKKKEVASDEEINKYLFGAPNATYLADYKKGVPLKLLSAGEETPQFDTKKDVKFGFSSKQHPVRQEFTFDTRAEITSTRLDFTKPLRVIIHGWQNSGNSPMIKTVSEAYLDKKDVMIMVVDWSLLAKENYLLARELTQDVGKITAEFLQYLIKDVKLVELKNVYLIGHSLGGHTAGFVGKELQKLGVGKVPILFALDPAGPLFTEEYEERRLDKNDAEFVIVLHTSTILGFTPPLGAADFYPNFGFSQPGCGVDLMRHCAHSRAYEYFAEAIQETTDEGEFWAVKCSVGYDEIESENCDATDVSLKYGESLEQDRNEGLFYFETNSEKPWAKGKRHLEELRLNKTSIIEISCKIIIFTLLAGYLITY